MHAHPANTIPLAGLLLLLATGAGASGGQAITDNGKLFSSDAVKSAEVVIDQIQMIHQKDLRIETFPDIPQDLLPRFQQQGKEKFFAQWANDRARQLAVDGVYILICRQPGRLEVWVGNTTARRLFTAGDRDYLVQKTIPFFRRHDYDAGLLGAVRFVQRQMDDRSKATEDPNAPLLFLRLRPGERWGEGTSRKASDQHGEVLVIPPHPYPLPGEEGEKPDPFLTTQPSPGDPP